MYTYVCMDLSCSVCTGIHVEQCVLERAKRVACSSYGLAPCFIKPRVHSPDISDIIYFYSIFPNDSRTIFSLIH